MEKEFIDLIRTFEKTATRLETLDTTILGFKDVVEGLRGNLDELVEMVQLEGIVDLSEKSHSKLLQLNEQIAKYEQASQCLNHNIDAFAELIVGESPSIDENFFYQLNEGQVHVIQKNQLGEVKIIEKLRFKKICSYLDKTFALNEEENALYLLNGTKADIILEMSIEDFYVFNYQVYILVAGRVERVNLLTKQKQICLENIEKIKLLIDGVHLLCQNDKQEVTFLKL